MVCSVFVFTLYFSYFNHSEPSYLRAQEIGANVKGKLMKATAKSQAEEQMSEKEMEEMARLESMDFKFTVPEGFIKQSKSLNAYISPINPFETRDKWFSYSVKERVELSQIPDSLLKSMSTEELIITCMNYNFIGDLFVTDTVRQAYEALKKQYNGLQELTQRPDSGEKLLKLYKAIDFKEFSNVDRFSIHHTTLLKLLLSDEAVLITLDENDVKEIVQIFYKHGMETIEGEMSVSDFLCSTYIGLKCLYYHDNNVRDVINGCEELKSFILGDKGFYALDKIDDVTIGKIVIIIQEKY